MNFKSFKNRTVTTPDSAEKEIIRTKTIRRRKLIKGLAGIPLMAGIGGTFFRDLSEQTSSNNSEIRTISRKSENFSDKDPVLPFGKLGNLNLTRLIMGCNQMSGFAHARDLLYANSLFQAYNTDEKVIETFYIGEQAGINCTFLTNRNYPVFHKYLNLYKGRMQSICQTYLKPADFLGDIDKAIANGANTLYIQGGEGDRYVREGKVRELARAIEHIKKKGFSAGIGAHSLEVVKICEREKLPVDYYVKTFHNDNYWSAHAMEERVEFSVDSQRNSDHNKIHDNMFDLFPSLTADFMKSVKKPWIAFKVLAAGAIAPKDGFRFAFENGADFICVGMFDFQVVDNVRTTGEILTRLGKRERGWYS